MRAQARGQLTEESDWVKQDITVTFTVMCSGKQRAVEKDLEEEGAS